ncbi:MAG: DUF1922 domain-containing protein [Promethearchaeota archaeon]
MQNNQNYYFFRCYNCGMWYYTKKFIKSKKCWRCNHSFTFKNATRFSKNCSLHEAVSIVKKLKEKI